MTEQDEQESEQYECDIVNICNKLISFETNKITYIGFKTINDYINELTIRIINGFSTIYLTYECFKISCTLFMHDDEKFDSDDEKFDSDEKFYKTYVIKFDINHFLQLLLQIIHEQKNRKHTEYLFTFSDLRMRENIIKNLDKKTWEMLSDVNFCGISDGIICKDGDYSQIQKHFKIEKLFIEAHKFLKFYETKSIDEDNTILIVEFYNTSYERTINDDIKKCLWTQSNPNCKILAVIFNDHWTNNNAIYNFWQIVTCGLGRLCNLQIAGPWYDFLTKGCYDPRLLIYIEQFAANFCTIKDASKYDFVIYDDRVMVKRN